MTPFAFWTVVIYRIMYTINNNIWLAIAESDANLLCRIIASNLFYAPVIVVGK